MSSSRSDFPVTSPNLLSSRTCFTDSELILMRIVYTQIFSRLHPRDLLSLARTSKAFRSFLMNRRSTRVWQAARQAVSDRIPQCPYELSEPKYAVLLFTSECMVSSLLHDSITSEVAHSSGMRHSALRPIGRRKGLLEDPRSVLLRLRSDRVSDPPPVALSNCLHCAF